MLCVACAALLGAVVAPATVQAEEAPRLTFSDVTGAHAFAREIRWMAGTGISDGYVDGTFRPLAPVSRQAMSAFMRRLAGDGLPEGSAGFSDVSEGHPFAEDVAWMAEQGIADGYVDGTFRPLAPVSRQAMSAFMRRLAGDGLPEGSAGFSDVSEGHPFAEDVAWMAEQGIADGYVDGTFRPSVPVSRQAMSAFLQRLWRSPGVDPAISVDGPGPNARGPWTVGESYELGDVVLVEDGPLAGGLYVATEAHLAGPSLGEPVKSSV